MAIILIDDTYYANATDYNGTTDYLSKAADLTGNADSRTGTLSFWFRVDGGNGTLRQIYYNTSGHVYIALNASNQVSISLFDSAGTNELSFRTGTGLSAGATWHHVLASWNTNAGSGAKTYQINLDGFNDTVLIADSSPAFDIDYTATNHYIAAQAGSVYFNGALAEFYFAMGQYLNINLISVDRKFLTVSNKPEFLGSTGELPTGTPPLIYLKNPAASVGTNAGTGGNFTVNGSPTIASTSPSL